MKNVVHDSIVEVYYDAGVKTQNKLCYRLLGLKAGGSIYVVSADADGIAALSISEMRCCPSHFTIMSTDPVKPPAAPLETN